MILVHHLNNSRSFRILWLLEELGCDYEIRSYTRDPDTLFAPEALKEVHPLGKAPVVTIDEEVLAESGYITEELVARYGPEKLAPPAGSEAGKRYRYWLHYSEGSLMNYLTLKLVFDRMEDAKVPFFVKPIVKAIAGRVKGDFIQPNLDRHLAYLDGEVAPGGWFAGDGFSAADIALGFPLMLAHRRAGLSKTKHPNLSDFLARCQNRPAFKAALDKGGPLTMG